MCEFTGHQMIAATSGLSAEDLRAAAQMCVAEAYHARRTLQMLSEYCPADHRDWLRETADAAEARRVRFAAAADALAACEMRAAMERPYAP